MPTRYKILGQSNPNAATDTIGYIVPEGANAVVSTLSVCNRANTAKTFRLAAMPSGNTLSNVHYIAYDTTVPGNETISLTLGLSLSANDHIYVRAIDTSLSFSIFGAEIT